MVLYGVDVYSESDDSIITQPIVNFTIIKVSQGMGYDNPKRWHQQDLAIKQGHKLGYYHYAGGGNPVAEADYFLSKLPAGAVGSGILALDWEKDQNASFGDYNWCKNFVDHVHEKTGLWCMVYCSEAVLPQVANCTNSPKWVAKYPSMTWYSWQVPNMSVAGNPTIWQFTGDNQDRDIFYGDKSAWDKIAKGDGRMVTTIKDTPSETPATKSCDTFTDNLGVTWFKEKGTFTVSVSDGIVLRWGATTKSAKITALPKGSVVKYDAFCHSGGYVWIRQPRADGSFAYLPTGESDGSKRTSSWGDFK